MKFSAQRGENSTWHGCTTDERRGVELRRRFSAFGVRADSGCIFIGQQNRAALQADGQKQGMKRHIKKPRWCGMHSPVCPIVGIALGQRWRALPQVMNLPWFYVLDQA